MIVLRCLFLAMVLTLTIFSSAEAEPAQPQLIEDFDGTWREGRWQFYDGHEFPGARGSFGRADNGHTGQGGRLEFDFTGGGNYVAAVLLLEDAPPVAAVRVWVRKPRGNRLSFRYTDQTDQTLQKSLSAPDDIWADVQINCTGWTGHWGGANDGTLHGPPKRIAFLIENSGQVRGSLFIDDVRLIPGAPDASLGMIVGEYVAARFDESEGWRNFGGKGDPGKTTLEGRSWRLDFTKGAQSVGIRPHDRCLLGTPRQFRVRVRGRADGHKIHLQLATHFQVFGAVSAPLAGDGEHEIVFDAPPGPGWHWFNGENDGALHGPLRIAGLFVSSEGKADPAMLELLDIRVKAVWPPQHAVVQLAELRQSGGKSRFVGIIRNMSMEAKQGTVTCTIRDWDGNTVAREQRKITLPPDAEPLEVAVPVPTGMHSFLEAEFAVESVDEIVAPAQAYLIAPLDEQRDAQLQPASPFGMGVYLYRYANTSQGLADMEKAATRAQNAGVKWSREEFHWSNIEREKGKFEWSFYDKLVATAQRHGITVYGILAYWSPWAKEYTPEGIADYCRFASAAAERYRDGIQHWEIWNEPNIFFWQGPRDQYAELLKQAFAAIKAANPKAQVLGCSTAGIDLKFIRRTMELGAPFDILTIHPYRGTLHDESFVASLKEVAEMVRPRPVWITEMGWGTHIAHNSMENGFVVTSQREQALLLARSYLNALGSGVISNMSWYDFRNDGDDPLNFEANMGILTRDFGPKPAYRAYATMTRLLRGKSVAAPMGLGKEIMAYQFRSDAHDLKPVIAIWSLQANRTVDVPSGEPLRIIDLMGQTRALKNQQGKVSVPVCEGVPVFLSTGE